MRSQYDTVVFTFDVRISKLYGKLDAINPIESATSADGSVTEETSSEQICTD